MNNKKSAFFAFILTAIAFTLCVLPPHVSAQEVTKRPLKYPLALEDEVPAVPVASSRTPIPLEPGSQSFPDEDYWTRAVFESYRDGNYEIYSMDRLVSGTDATTTRLTYEAESDLYPRLNKGASKIVFTSYRDGNAEIYGMDWNGNNLKRLTNNGVYDSLAAWSPEGSKIAFTSYRDGNYEIYVMNADGSNPVRLTNSNSIDFEPTWSPDGRQIAWVRVTGSDQGSIMAMDADGKNQHTLIHSLYYVEDVSWSPSGRYIAFSYDANGDGWLDLAMMNSDGTGLRTITYQNYLMDNLMGSWTAKEDMLISTIYYVVVGGQLYIDNASLYTITPDNTRISNFQYDAMFPDAQLFDLSIPESSVKSLPKYSRVSGVPVTVQGKDEPAGIYSYKLQYRAGDSGNWQDWTDIYYYQPTQTVTYTTGTAGSTVYFRSQARDWANHLEAWPDNPQGDARTTLFTWNLAGKVTDNRGNPFFQLPVAINPSPLETSPTSPNGEYLSYLQNVGNHTIQASKNGYGSFLPTIRSVNSDDTVILYLPASVNWVQNGDFEQAGLTGWSTNGATPKTDVGQAGSGSSYVILGKSPLGGPPTNISNTSDLSGNGGPPRIVRDAAGNLQVVWYDQTYQGILQSTGSPQGKWSAPIFVSLGCLPDLAIDSQGTLHLIWTDWSDSLYTIYYAYKAGGGNWSQTQTIAGPMAKQQYYYSTPRLVVDRHDSLHVVWDVGGDTGVWYIGKTSGGAWSAPEHIFANGFSPDLTTGLDDRLHLLWRDFYNKKLLYAYRPLTGNWNTPQDIDGGFPDAISYLKIAEGPDQAVHALWTGGSVLMYSQESTNGSWTDPATIATLPFGSFTDLALAVSPDNFVHVTWVSYMNFRAMFYAVRYPDHTWSQPFQIPDFSGGGGPAIWAETNGKGQLVWYQDYPYYTNTEILYDEMNLPAERKDTASQTIALPVNAHQPTLSFMYRLSSLLGDHASLEVSVNGVQVFSTDNPQPVWTQGWADLSDWSGQTVTVTFTAHSTSGQGIAIADLDSVSAGEWLTPLVKEVVPKTVDDWSSGRRTVTINGFNFISTPTVRLDSTILTGVQWIDDRTLVITLPADLKPGFYHVEVINPGGQEGALPFGLQVGKRVLLPILY